MLTSPYFKILCYSLYQQTPLYIAVREGQEVTVKILVGKGADVTIHDKHGVSVTVLLVLI